MTERRVVKTEGAPGAIGPYSQAVVAGVFVYASGQVGFDPATGQFVEGGVAEQTRQVLRNLSRVLEAAGSDLSRVVKTTVFLADIGDWPAVNEVYARVMPQPFPARSAFAVKDLPLGARIEIEAVATAGLG